MLTHDPDTLNGNSDRNNIKCDAEGCNSNAVKKIKIPAGRFGTVTLCVCQKCEGKFRD